MNHATIRWLAAALVVTWLPHVFHLPAWVSAVFLGGIALRLTLGRPLPPWLLTMLALAVFAVVMAEFRTFTGHEAGSALFTALIGLKFLEARNFRDGGLLACLAYFQAAAILLVSQEMSTTAWVLAAVLVTTLALASLAAPHGRPPLATRLRMVGRLTLQAMPVMLVLFLLFPRLSGPLWGIGEGGDDEPAARTGISDTMTPGNVAELAVSQDIAFRVQFDGATPEARQQYWRGPVLWTFDGYTWKQGERASDIQPNADRAGATIDYTLALEPHQRHWVFALDLPAHTPSGVEGNEAFQLQSRSRITSTRRFTMRSVLDYRFEAELPDARRERAIQLPETGAERARELARQWAQEYRWEPRALVDHALDWIRDNDFVYTLQPQTIEEDPVDEFLFDIREGFCESYASSFAVLMRAAGIPARVVMGYQGGEAGFGDYLIIRQAHAHSWVEVWLPESGWTRVDPTAATAPDRFLYGLDTLATAADGARGGARRFDWRHRLALAIDTLYFNWDQFVLGYGPELQERLLSRVGLDDVRRATLGALAIGGGTVVLMTVWLLGSRPPRRPRDPVLQAWQRVEDRLAAVGIRRAPGEGPRDFAERVMYERPDLREAVQRLSDLYLRLRYGPDAHDMDARTLLRDSREFRPRQRASSAGGRTVSGAIWWPRRRQ